MITKRVVFLLGAGASRGYGYPTGAQLMAALASISGDQLYELERIGGDAQETNEFQERLGGCGLNSVDSFLQKNPRFARAAKVRIAQELAAAEYKAARSAPEDTWLQYLFANFMDGGSLDAFTRNNCTFVTLNYDRSLEFHLTKMLSNAYDAPWKEAADTVRTIKTIHLHGLLAPLPDHERLYGSPFGSPEMNDAVKGILILGESGSEKEYVAAKEALAAAEVIFCLGFGFHKEVINNLDLRNGTLAIHGSCQGMTQSEVTSVVRQFAPRQFVELHRDGATWNHRPREPGPAVDYLRSNVELLV